jgi:hypothetical protein
VRSSRVDEIAQLVENSASPLAEGVPISGEPRQYVYTKLPSLRPALLEEATKDALARAEVLARSTDAELGRAARGQRWRLPGHVAELDRGQRLRRLRNLDPREGRRRLDVVVRFVLGSRPAAADSSGEERKKFPLGHVLMTPMTRPKEELR